MRTSKVLASNKNFFINVLVALLRSDFFDDSFKSDKYYNFVNNVNSCPDAQFSGNAAFKFFFE